METKLEGRESVEARDWKKRSDSKGVYADRGGIPHCPPGRPLGEESLGMGATVIISIRGSLNGLKIWRCKKRQIKARYKLRPKKKKKNNKNSKGAKWLA